MASTRYIASNGGIAQGFIFYGPFDSLEDAQEFRQEAGPEDWTIMPLHRPAELFEADAEPRFYSAVEDNGGGLSLFVFSDKSRESCIYAHSGYEEIPGQLSEDIGALRQGDSTEGWNITNPMPQETWDQMATFISAGNGGAHIIADEAGILPAEDMGAAGCLEFYSSKDA